jgi:hypothetical protein
MNATFSAYVSSAQDVSPLSRLPRTGGSFLRWLSSWRAWTWHLQVCRGIARLCFSYVHSRSDSLQTSVSNSSARFRYAGFVSAFSSSLSRISSSQLTSRENEYPKLSALLPFPIGFSFIASPLVLLREWLCGFRVSSLPHSDQPERVESRRIQRHQLNPRLLLESDQTRVPALARAPQRLLPEHRSSLCFCSCWFRGLVTPPLVWLLVSKVCRVIAGLMRAFAVGKGNAFVREVYPLPAKAAAIFSFRLNQCRFHVFNLPSAWNITTKIATYFQPIGTP